MIEKKIYVCERCGGEYNSPEVCSMCESRHSKISKIVTYEYPCQGSIPNGLEVELDDGAQVKYKLVVQSFISSKRKKAN